MTNKVTIRSRFTPSPTGLMHLGNLRTALFSYLFAKSQQAAGEKSAFLLRIEDTDAARSKDEYTQALINDLHWLGMDWEEGPKAGESTGEYFQSQRGEIYETYYQQLLKQGDAFWCYCTEAELSLQRKAQLQAGAAPRYAGTCRHLTESQIAKKQALGIKPALRFKVADAGEIRFNDLIQGPKLFNCADLGDFIIQKQDGSASFMFCNAVDDALMEVTHVLRGEDHLTNTPRQLIILQALGLKAPHYAHMALILGFDGKPLSKRNGSHSIRELRDGGYLQLAILNYLARLGHNITDNSYLSLDELGKAFALGNINKSAARYDEMQLNNWQKIAVEKADIATQIEWLEKNNVHVQQAEKLLDVVKGNISFPKDVEFWSQRLNNQDSLEYSQEAKGYLSKIDTKFWTCLKDYLKTDAISYSALIEALKKEGFNGKALFMPLRAIFTGETHGPELQKIFDFLGKDALIQRVELAQRKFMIRQQFMG
ncbi:glutamate--tRNA ligase [Candidatus Berkiella cookevillensis]|uniref:Glutamate--tRNA ligase n=1 Tax=Candidatus Berkiella cookevillensis TaxID=437022 RepID=A0A0Q9Y9H8_9GAMM|nr:glutamate--tRNA ligase [Candidatus Berkiella cookevillensis]MCS5708770.1 glutamate--tRNA ligase [Candidatus Berkiella cookevillensis]